MTYGGLLNEGERLLSLENIRDSKTDAWLILESLTHMDRAKYYLLRQNETEAGLCKKYFELIDKRKQHIPLQHITGYQEFMGLEFIVNPHVLVPRQDTEILVEQALSCVNGKKVLDLCTGSGCIAISLAVLGNPQSVTASDKSEKALAVAEENAKRLKGKGLNIKGPNAGKTNNEKTGIKKPDVDITFIQSDLFENINEKFDVIVSNPPYISEKEMRELEPEVKEHDPQRALWGGMDGLFFYREIIKSSPAYINAGGSLFFETGCNQGMAVAGLMRQQGYENVEIIKDYAGLDRVVRGECN